MNLYIPTAGRPLSQRTFSLLPDELRVRTKMVVTPEDEDAYAKVWGNEHILVTNVKGIALKRDFILDFAEEKNLVMLDDDITIQRLRPGGKITNCDPGEILEAFDWLDTKLDSYAHAGFAVRFSDKGGGSGDKIGARMMHVLAYNMHELPETARFTRNMPDPEHGLMEDFNMTLQLLTAGLPNIVSNEWRISPYAANAKGGCSSWRTREMQNAAAVWLKSQFPKFVSLREKNSWSGIEGEKMVDVTVQWKAAYEGSI